MAVAASLSPAEYFARQEDAQARLELVRGEIREMPGGSFAHNIVKTRIARLLGNALNGTDCVVMDSDMRIGVGEGSYVCADASLASPPHVANAASGVVDNPVLVVEVLSPGTERYDRREKFALYESLASLRQYVLVDSEARFFEVFTRAAEGWNYRLVRQGAVRLDSVGVEVPLDGLYEGSGVE